MESPDFDAGGASGARNSCREESCSSHSRPRKDSSIFKGFPAAAAPLTELHDMVEPGLPDSGAPSNENVVFASSKRVTIQVLRGKESCCPNEHTAGSSCAAETVGALFSPQDGGERASEREKDRTRDGAPG